MWALFDSLAADFCNAMGSTLVERCFIARFAQAHELDADRFLFPGVSSRAIVDKILS
jgi:hypothetical protein